MIVVLNGTSLELLEGVGSELARLDWSPLGGPVPEVKAGVFDDPEPLRRLRAGLASRDPESYVLRLREEGHPGTAAQDAAAERGDVGFVVEADGRSAASLALEIAGIVLEEVRLEEPRSGWPERFEEERELLESTLGHRLVGLHHVGSTALPDVPAKPILDLLGVLPELELFASCLGPLGRSGYSFLDYPENHRRRFLRKGRPRTHHLHVVEAGSQELADHLDFRDALLADAALRREYGELKRSLAVRHARARAAYGEGKTAFVRRVLRRWRRAADGSPAASGP